MNWIAKLSRTALRQLKGLKDRWLSGYKKVRRIPTKIMDLQNSRPLLHRILISVPFIGAALAGVEWGGWAWENAAIFAEKMLRANTDSNAELKIALFIFGIGVAATWPLLRGILERLVHFNESPKAKAAFRVLEIAAVFAAFGALYTWTLEADIRRRQLEQLAWDRVERLNQTGITSDRDVANVRMIAKLNGRFSGHKFQGVRFEVPFDIQFPGINPSIRERFEKYSEYLFTSTFLGIKFFQVLFEECSFREFAMDAAEFSYVEFNSVSLIDSSLSEVKCRICTLLGSNFTNSQSLAETDYNIMPKMEQMNFEDSTLTATSFNRVSLIGSHFKGTSLTVVKFFRSDLRLVIFQESAFNRAEFNGSNLRRADFSSATGLTEEAFAGACFDETTKLPPNLKHLKPSWGPECEERWGTVFHLKR